MIIIDSSVIYALLDSRDQLHASAGGWYAGMDEELATTPLVLAEVDHLAGSRAGEKARDAFLGDVQAGAYNVQWWETAAQESTQIARRYRELAPSLTDASLVALAARLDVLAIATFDERHFRAIRPHRPGKAFRLLPIDA